MLRHHATVANLLRLFGVWALAALVSHFFVLPAYRSVASGFDPFNVQYPLTRAMIAIQRGAFSSGVDTAYLIFAVLDAITLWVRAALIILFWVWIMVMVPHPMFENLCRGGVLLFPVWAALCGMADTFVITKLVVGDPHEPFHDLTNWMLNVHHIKFMLVDVNLAITVVLMVCALYLQRRRSKVGRTQ